MLLMIDTWNGKIYPAYEIYRRLEFGIAKLILSLQLPALIIWILLTPGRSHYCFLKVQHSTLEALKSWRIKHGIPSEPGEPTNVLLLTLGRKAKSHFTTTAYAPSDADVRDDIAEI